MFYYRPIYKRHLIETINQTNLLIRRVDFLKNRCSKSPQSLSFKERERERERDELKECGRNTLANMQTISAFVEKDQSLMIEEIQGPYGESTNVISWMMSVQPWFDDMEKYMLPIN